MSQDACVTTNDTDDVPPEDQAMSASDLESLVRASVFEAVRGSVTPPPDPQPDAILLVGSRAGNTVRRAVVASVRELVGEGALLSGPLREAARKLAEASEVTEKLWRGLQELEEKVDKETSGPPLETTETTPSASVAERAIQPIRDSGAVQKRCAGCQTTLDVLNRSQRNSVYCTSCLVDEAASASPKPAESTVAPTVTPELKPEKPSGDTPKSDAVLVIDGDVIVLNGRRIPVPPKASPEFRAFLLDFAGRIALGPVRSGLAVELAAAHGYGYGEKNPTGAVRGTVVFQLEQYLGDFSKWADEEGERWWSLPNSNERPTGSRRRR